MALNKITEIRKTNGLSIEELAKKSGVPLGTLSKICAGITKDPKLETMKAIARALNCTLDDFDDISSVSHNINSLTSAEQILLKKYRALDHHGTDMVDTVLGKEYERITALQKFAPSPIAQDPQLIAEMEKTDYEIDALKKTFLEVSTFDKTGNE